MCDGSTDSAVLEQELVYARFLDNGLPVSKFVSIQELKAGNASGIIDGLDAAFEHVGFSPSEWREHLVAFGADGAAVMLGRTRGVAALLKQDVAYMIEIHCVAHRLELGILDAMKHERRVKDIKDTLQGIYKHYHYLSKALRELREVADALEVSVLKPVNVMGTRWVSHLSRALTVLLKNMQHIVLHLQHTVEARSSSSEIQGRVKLVSRQLQSLKTVMFMHFILDVLEETSIVSQVFQKESSTLTKVCTALQRVELGMSAMVGRPAQNLQMFLENCITDGSCTKFKDVELVGDYEEEIAALTAVKARIIDCVLEFLFPDSPLLSQKLYCIVVRYLIIKSGQKITKSLLPTERTTCVLLQHISKTL